MITEKEKNNKEYEWFKKADEAKKTALLSPRDFERWAKLYEKYGKKDSKAT